jgi:hypothetical protein
MNSFNLIEVRLKIIALAPILFNFLQLPRNQIHPLPDGYFI